MKARQQTSFLFDLDGTLVDSVYDHVIAWHDALQEEGIEVSIWRLHRKIGMSGGLFTKALARETGKEFGPRRWSACASCMPSTMASVRRGPGRCPARRSCWPISPTMTFPGPSPLRAASRRRDRC